MPAPVSALSLCDSDKQQIQQWASAFGTPQQVVLRCRIVLAAASGQSDNSIAEQLQINRKTVMLWRARMAQQGLKSLSILRHCAIPRYVSENIDCCSSQH